MFFPRQRAIWSSFMACTEVPSIRISPEVGRSMPVIMFTSVDFPAPDLPITVRNSPRCTCKFTPRKAGVSPAGFDKP